MIRSLTLLSCLVVFAAHCMENTPTNNTQTSLQSGQSLEKKSCKCCKEHSHNRFAEAKTKLIQFFGLSSQNGGSSK
ncbi:hypothetical protein M1446_03970 [Candidatus Dependentiae bacterium]|nr:hypothetical protein [Candidatus Dependentiae bacterium]